MYHVHINVKKNKLSDRPKDSLCMFLFPEEYVNPSLLRYHNGFVSIQMDL